MPATTAFADKPTLTGERVVLRPFHEADLPALATAIADPEVGRLTGSVHTSEEAGQGHDEARLREWYLTRNDQDDRLDLAIVDRRSGSAWRGRAQRVGAGERLVQLPHRSVAAAAASGTEATRLILGHAFESLGLHRVGLEVYAFNPRGRRAYGKVGFVEEGLRRDALRFDGEFVDSVLMSVLAPEWDQHRGRP